MSKINIPISSSKTHRVVNIHFDNTKKLITIKTESEPSIWSNLKYHFFGKRTYSESKTTGTMSGYKVTEVMKTY